MRKWEINFRDGQTRVVLADGRYEAVVKAAVSTGLAGYPSAFILTLVKSAKVTEKKRQSGRPKSHSAWSEQNWEKEMGNE